MFNTIKKGKELYGKIYVYTGITEIIFICYILEYHAPISMGLLLQSGAKL